MSVVILGPGALGSVFGAVLAQNGVDVALLGKPGAHLAAIRATGLRFHARDGTIATVPLLTSEDPAVVDRADAVIVLVKSGDTGTAMRAIGPFLRSGTPVLTLQNGLGNAATMRAILGDDALILEGVTSQGALRFGPGEVAHTGAGPTLIGYRNERQLTAANEIASMFTAAGIPAALTPDIDRHTWRKVAINAAINGLSAVGGFPNGTIAEDERLFAAAEIIAEEAAAVARALGHELGAMRRAVLDTALATAENRSSMLQDIESQRATEVDAIHGAILDASRTVGVATPAIAVLDALIRARSRMALSKDASDD